MCDEYEQQPRFDHPKFPGRQFCFINVHLDDGSTWHVSTHQDDVVWGLSVTRLGPGTDWRRTPEPLGSAFRWVPADSWLSGHVDHCEPRLSKDTGLISEVHLTIEGQTRILVAAEAYEEGGDALSLVMDDESVLLFPSLADFDQARLAFESR